MAIPGLRRLFRLALGRSTAEADADAEVRLHLELRAEELIAEGWGPEAARAEALRRFGNLPAIARTLRGIDRGSEQHVRRSEWFGALLGDVRQALRGFRLNPGFTLGAVLTLALGIGMTTAVFSVYQGVVLRPLPYQDPGRLVRIWSNQLSRSLPFFSTSAPDFRDWRSQSTSFERLGAYERQRDFTLNGGGEPEQLLGTRVSADILTLLGVNPVLGRSFSAAEDAPGSGDRPVLIGWGLWQRRFGGSREVLGRVLDLGGGPATVIGVMPQGFVLPGNPAELWFPLGGVIQDSSRGNHFLRVLGRLKPGVSPAAAHAELETIHRRLAAQYPGSNTGWGVTLLPLIDAELGKSFHSGVTLLLGAVALVLLIACANVATMILGRNTARTRELAVRIALGAGQGRLARLLLAEGLVIGAAGGLLGVGLAFGLVRLLHALEPGNLPRVEAVAVNGIVLLVAASLAIGCGIAFGLVPLRRAAGVSLTSSLREGGRGTGSGRERQRVQRALVVAQLTLAVLLLSGSGLLIRSLVQLQQVPLGFNPENVLAQDLALAQNRYPTPGAVITLYERLLERARALPGVRDAAAVSAPPLTGNNPVAVFAVVGRPVPDVNALPDADYRIVTPGYFRTVDIPLLRGRDFTPADDSTVVILTESTARRHLEGTDPLGARIRLGDETDGPVVEVVGVVGDARYLSLETPEPRPMLYFPLRRTGTRAMTVLLRSNADPGALAQPLRAELHALDAAQPLGAVRTLDEIVAQTYAGPRFNVVIFGLFAVVAILLAGIGLYGVMAWAVRQRTQELGVRLALGANPGQVVRMVLGSSLRLALLGIGFGLAGALLLNRTLTDLLFGVKPGDPLALLIACLLLVGIALLSSYAPARRAARVSPMETLRVE